MNILFITPYKEFTGGVESVNSILESIFIENGHSVTFLTTDGFKASLIDRLFIKIIGLPYVTKKRFRNIKNIYDIIIANGEFGYGIDHKNCINLFHGSYVGYRDYLKPMWNLKQYIGFTRHAIIQRISSRNKIVVTVSTFIKEILENNGVTSVKKVIPNCVDTNFFKPDFLINKNKRYLFVGANNYYAKGFDVLEKLSMMGYPIDCVTNSKPSKLLGWVGSVDYKEMPRVYSKYSFMIFPSRFEGLGLAPLEAMACGLPVVIKNIGLGLDLEKIIPEFVVSSDDPNEYDKRIKAINLNYDIFSKMAIDYVCENHSYQNYKKQWLDLIGSMVDC